MLHIHDRLIIPDRELKLSFSRSGGAGGQHVNRTETRVELRFDLAATSLLSDAVKARVRARYPAHVTDAGELIVVSDTSRSQVDNRADAEQRMAAMIRACLHAPRPRKKTTVSRAQKRRRLEDKRRRSDLKRSRRAPDRD